MRAVTSFQAIAWPSPRRAITRGDADEDSDLDLLVDVAPGRGLFALGAFAFAVKDVLGVFTQVVTVPGLKIRMGDRVLAEAVPV